MSFKYWYYTVPKYLVLYYSSVHVPKCSIAPNGNALPTDAGTCVGAVPAVQRAPPAHAPQRAPPRSQRVAAWRVAASLPYGALPAVRAPRRASSRPPPSWRPPAPRESCAARAARARRPSSRPHRARHPSKTPPARLLCLRQSRFCSQMLKHLACGAGAGVRTNTKHHTSHAF